MARAYHPTLKLPLSPITTQLPSCSRSDARVVNFAVHAQLPTRDGSASASLEKAEALKEPKQRRRKGAGARRGLISVGTLRSDASQWCCEFAVTLRQLQLADLTEDGRGDAQVLVDLLVQQHARFGLSIEGRVVTSFNRICDCCSSPYSIEIDENFDVWVLNSSRNRENGMPEIGGSDPSVMYVKPGSSVDLDSLVQDTIMLTASSKSTCSDTCGDSTVVWQYDDGKKQRYDQRWSKLVELKKKLEKAPS